MRPGRSSGFRPPTASRWVVIGTVEGVCDVPPGVWIDVDRIEERRPAEHRAVAEMRVHYNVTPPRCLIRSDFVVSAQMLKDPDEPVDTRPAHGE